MLKHKTALYVCLYITIFICFATYSISKIHKTQDQVNNLTKTADYKLRVSRLQIRLDNVEQLIHSLEHTKQDSKDEVLALITSQRKLYQDDLMYLANFCTKPEGVRLGKKLIEVINADESIDNTEMDLLVNDKVLEFHRILPQSRKADADVVSVTNELLTYLDKKIRTKVVEADITSDSAIYSILALCVMSLLVSIYLFIYAVTRIFKDLSPLKEETDL